MPQDTSDIENTKNEGGREKRSKRTKEPPFDRSQYNGDTPIEKMILALCDEIEFADKHLETQTLKNGERIRQLGELFLYRFALDRGFDLDPDENLAVAVNGIDYRGKVTQVDLGHVIIGIKQDHGELLTKAVIAKAENVLEKLLRKQLVDVVNKTSTFHHKQADFVIGEREAHVEKAPIPSAVSAFLSAQNPPWSLNAEQVRLIKIARESDYTILWGPPGTGKTTVIGLLTASLLAQGRRVLVASNTNKAVDGALAAILETHVQIADALPTYDPEKTIIRPGSDGITQEFKDKWGEVALLDEVVKSRTVELVEERDELTREKDRLDPELRKIQSGLAVYRELHELSKREVELPDLHQQALDEADQQRRLMTKLTNDIGRLEAEYDQAPEEETLKTRLDFGRAREVVQKELIQVRHNRKAAQEALEKAQGLIANYAKEMNATAEQLTELKTRIADLDSEDQLRERLNEIESRISDIVGRLSQIAKALDEMAATVLREADVIGTTVHKTFLDPILSKLDFDAVIIDEASMVVLPMTYWAAGRSKKQVIIVGDFKQLPAIVKNNDSDLVSGWMAQTPFDKCGIRQAVKDTRKGKPLPANLVALKEQNRMHDEIGCLVSDQFYEGLLVTGKRVLLSRAPASRLPGQETDKRLLMIDTKDIGAWSSPPFSGKGRFNPTHVALALSLIDKMVMDGALVNDRKSAMERIGFVAPYAGQAELFLKATDKKYRELIHESSIGTAHRFQGSERDIIVFDYVMSEGRTYPSRFLDSEDGEDQPANLLNVAVSRAKEHLVLIYNSDDFGEKGTTEWMRQFLVDYARRAEHLSARDLLDESSILGEVRNLAHGRSFEIDMPTTLHDESGFYGGVRQDLMSAQKSVVIFSAFATPKNLSRWMDVFQALLERGLKLRVVIKPISHQPNTKQIGEQLMSMFNTCRRAGITVDMRTVTHEKAVIIDERVVWHGSLNMLSQERDRTAEVMTRTVSVDFAEQILKLLSRHDLKQPDPSLPQLPVCPTCGGPSSLVVSRNGKEHLVCENGCGYITGKWNFASLARAIPVGRHLGPCPDCRDGIIKVHKSYSKIMGKCSNAFAKNGKDKCTYQVPLFTRDLAPYEPYPPTMTCDPGLLKSLEKSFSDHQGSSERESEKRNTPRVQPSTSPSSRKKQLDVKNHAYGTCPEKVAKRKARPRTDADLDDFLSRLN